MDPLPYRAQCWSYINISILKPLPKIFFIVGRFWVSVTEAGIFGRYNDVISMHALCPTLVSKN